MDNGPTPVNLPLLASVGDFIISPKFTKGVALSLPALSTAGNLGVGENSSTTKYNPWMVSLPALSTVASIDLDGTRTGDLALPALSSVSPGGITIQGPYQSTSALLVPQIKTIGGDLSVNGYAPASHSLSWPTLTSIGGAMTFGMACLGGPFCACAPAGTFSSLSFPNLVKLGATNSGALTMGMVLTLPAACYQGLVQQLQQAGWTGPSQLATSVPPCLSMMPTGPCP